MFDMQSRGSFMASPESRLQVRRGQHTSRQMSSNESSTVASEASPVSYRIKSLAEPIYIPIMSSPSAASTAVVPKSADKKFDSNESSSLLSTMFLFVKLVAKKIVYYCDICSKTTHIDTDTTLNEKTFPTVAVKLLSINCCRRLIDIFQHLRYWQIVYLIAMIVAIVILSSGPIDIHPKIEYNPDYPSTYAHTRVSMSQWESDANANLKNIKMEKDKFWNGLQNHKYLYDSITPHSNGHNWVLPIDNKAPLIHRLRLHSYFDFLKPAFREPTVTSNLTYIHVHKCGGTTVVKLFESLSKSNNIPFMYAPHVFGEEFFRERPRDLLFTYVRDPISRALSGYFEVKKRGYGATHWRTGLDGFRDMLRDMKQLKSHNRFPWRINHHIWPQILFLVDKRGIPLRFDYIGRTELMDWTLPFLIHRFAGVDTSMVTQFMNQTRARSRGNDKSAGYTDADLNKELIQVSQLSNEDILDICDLYWIDFWGLDLETPNLQCQTIVANNLNTYGNVRSLSLTNEHDLSSIDEHIIKPPFVL